MTNLIPSLEASKEHISIRLNDFLMAFCIEKYSKGWFSGCYVLYIHSRVENVECGRLFFAFISQGIGNRRPLLWGSRQTTSWTISTHATVDKLSLWWICPSICPLLFYFYLYFLFYLFVDRLLIFSGNQDKKINFTVHYYDYS